MRLSFLPVLVLVGAVCALPHCSSADRACVDAAMCGVDGGPDGTLDGGGGPDAPVDPCAKTPTAASCVTEAKALFVSGSADDSMADGTRSKPYRTLAGALGKVTADKKRIYVCEGTYLEDLRLTAAHAGVSVVGGLTCEWAPSTTRPVFGKSMLALKVDGADGVSFEAIELHAADATGAGESSIAALLVSSKVTFTSVALKAGKATAKGPSGTLTPLNLPGPAALAGKGGDSPGNGAGGQAVCPGGGTTKGGNGGLNGFPGDPGTPGPANGNTDVQCAFGQNGGNGLPGTTASSAAGAARLGLLDASGWRPEAGMTGTNGTPGQGGGGGAGRGGGGGGGGGAGGCGGAGGGGGGGAGGSIALASFKSTVTLATSSLVADNAGNGGDGASGQAGTVQGGIGGAKASPSTACNGGSGGAGGDGASGGGGAGGVSVGVVYTGTAPSLDATTTANVSFGTKGTGGGGGQSGVDGLAVDVHEAK